MVSAARDLLKLYRRREDAIDHRTARSLMPIMKEIMQLGCTPTSSPDLADLRLSPVQQWVVSFAWAKMHFDPIDWFIMEAHLTRDRNQRTWKRIAIDIEATTGRGRTTEWIAARYALTVPAFMRQIEKAGITRDLDTARPVSIMLSLPEAVSDPKVGLLQFMRIIPSDLLSRALAA
jgi:hypothetical protein